MTPDVVAPQHHLGQQFLRQKTAGWIGPRQQAGYPLGGGAAWSLADGSEAPLGHTGTAQVAQAPTPPPFGSGSSLARGPVPAIYVGNPDLTSYPG
jgi:hypothetical protein